MVNSDQTGQLYASGSNLTWTKTGAKQISTVGKGEKRAFTVNNCIANSGDTLPGQAVYKGKSTISEPDGNAPCYAEAVSDGWISNIRLQTTIGQVRKRCEPLLTKYSTHISSLNADVLPSVELIRHTLAY